jgi:vacuolar-type H+-ATPase subunit I/STV1
MEIVRMFLLGVLLFGVAAAFAFADSNSAAVDNDSNGEATPSASPSVQANGSPVRAMMPGVRAKFRYCTMEFEPFLCPDGKQYANKCFAKLEGWDPQKDCTRVGSENVSDLVKENVREKIAERERLREEFKEKIEGEVKNDSRYNRCKQFSDAAQREACIKTETGIGELAREKIKCQAEDNETQCLDGLKENLRDAWRFRFESVIENAEKLERKGVSNETIAAFVAFVKEQALAFENATSADAKKEIVKNVAAEWKEFRKKVLNEILENGIAAASQRLQNALDALKQVREKLQARNLTTQGLDNAISKLEENMARINSENATLREKWVLSHESIERLKHAKNAAVKIINRMNVEDFIQPSVSVPAEVEDAEGAEN